MLQIKPIDLHWIGPNGEREDLCAHGGVVFRLGERIVLDDSEEEWTLSAAGLFLLRTLMRDHTEETPLCEHLFPHCGHGMFAGGVEVDEEVWIAGCSSGRTGELRHADGQVLLKLDNGESSTVTEEAWRGAVLDFCEVVERFYENCEAKVFPIEDDGVSQDGYEAFWREWRRRRGTAAST